MERFFRSRRIIDALRPRLRTFRAVSGAELFDLPEAPRPDPDAPAPARLLPGFDNLTLSYPDRTRFLADAHRRRIATANEIFHPTFLVDGQIGGLWKMEIGKKQAHVAIAPFARATGDRRSALESEAAALLTAAADARDHDVRFARR